MNDANTRSESIAPSFKVLFSLMVILIVFLIGNETVGQPDEIPPEIRQAIEAQQQKARSRGNSKNKDEQKPDENKEGEKEAKDDGDEKEKKDDGEDEDGPPKPILRSDVGQESGRTEIDIKPDADGRIRFNFSGQPWPAFLEWLADAGGYSLDWQKLPGDKLNLRTSKPYTIPEARNLVNRMLLDRGYTMVLKGEMLSVFELAKLDPSMLHRASDESELMDLPPHDFVKITFALPDEMKANLASEDIKQLLSPNGKVQPMMATNRLLVIDAVANLREVSLLLNNEHAAATGKIVPQEFRLKYARADHVADQVMILLGLDPASRRTPQELQLETKRLELFGKMQQKGKDVTKYLRNNDAPPVFLTVNQRLNSIMVNAPPAQLRVIARSIEILDKPTGGETVAAATLTRDGAPAKADGKQPWMDKYKLVTLTPEAIITALEEIGDLAPQTRLKMDSDAKTIFAFATPEDHAKIERMIGRLDGTGRSLQVVWLRRLPADAVAQTIQNLMVGPKDEKSNRSSYFGYYSYRSRSQPKEKPNEGFRVDADVVNQRLLLYANETEMEEVNSFLEKLGELPGKSGNPNTVRVLDPIGAEESLKLLERIQREWKAQGGGELQIRGGVKVKPKESADTEEEQPDAKENDPLLKIKPQRTTSTATSTKNQLAQLSDDFQFPGGPANPPTQQNQNTSTVSITVEPDGRLILNSQDTKALDKLQYMMSQLSPGAKDYEIFYLKNALASLVTLNLEEYFEDEGTFDSQENWQRAWMGMDFKKSKSGQGLSSRNQLRFIYDIDTNSILVSNATPEQLATVRNLIEIYDKAPDESSISARRIQVFKLNYARVDEVATTIKEVYRDLLSSKDKEFATKGNEEKREASQTTNYYRVYGAMDDGKKKPTKIKASFGGALSVGVNAATNTMIVSAQEEWMPSVARMIEILDNEAKPVAPDVVVHRFEGALDAATLQKALSDVFGEGNAQVTKRQATDQEKQMASEGQNGRNEQPQQRNE